MSECADIEAVLTEREKTHGRFEDQARVTEGLKDVIYSAYGARVSHGQTDLTASQIQAIDMIALKLGRIIAGDPNHPEHIFDIIGYATLYYRGLCR